MKDETATVLEYLPNGYPLEKKMMPLAQAIGESNFTLLELVPRRGIALESGESVYIGQGKRDKIYYILGRLPPEKLTESSKQQSEAINKRFHQIELLPGLGKKHMKEIITQRQEKLFESFEDMKKRIPNLPDPHKSIEKRMFKELTQTERHNLFVKGN